MCTWDSFTKIIKSLRVDPYTSTSSNLNAQRLNAAFEVLNRGIQTFNPAATIPTKLAQAVISGYSICSIGTKMPEKLAHLLQCGITLGQLGLAIALIYTSSECEDLDQNDLCNVDFILGLLYSGTLLVSWGVGEFSPETASAIPAIPANPANPANPADNELHV